MSFIPYELVYDSIQMKMYIRVINIGYEGRRSEQKKRQFKKIHHIGDKTSIYSVFLIYISL